MMENYNSFNINDVMLPDTQRATKEQQQQKWENLKRAGRNLLFGITATVTSVGSVSAETGSGGKTSNHTESGEAIEIIRKTTRPLEEQVTWALMNSERQISEFGREYTLEEQRNLYAELAERRDEAEHAFHDAIRQARRYLEQTEGKKDKEAIEALNQLEAGLPTYATYFSQSLKTYMDEEGNINPKIVEAIANSLTTAAYPDDKLDKDATITDKVHFLANNFLTLMNKNLGSFIDVTEDRVHGSKFSIGEKNYDARQAVFNSVVEWWQKAVDAERVKRNREMKIKKLEREQSAPQDETAGDGFAY